MPPAAPRSLPRRLTLIAIVLVLAAWLLCVHRCSRPTSLARKADARSMTDGGTTAAPADVIMKPDSPASSIGPREEAGPSMHALTFTMDAQGIHLGEAVVVSGRVKAPPRSRSPRRIEFEVSDRDGKVVYSGAIEHPLHHRYEYEDSRSPGSLKRIEQDVSQNTFQVRVPGDLDAAQIAFVDVRTGDGREARTPVASITLR